MYKSVILKDKILYINYETIDWIDKKSYCAYEPCSDIDIDEKCPKNMWSHCCKHVINANEEEKASFIYAVGLKSIADINDNIELAREKYKNLSRDIVEVSEVFGVSAGVNSVNILCNGNNKMAGFVDYLSYEALDNGIGRLGIVSSFFKGIDLVDYYMFIVCKEYSKNHDFVDGIIVKEENHSDSIEEYGKIEYAFSQINVIDRDCSLDKKTRALIALYLYSHKSIEKKIDVGYFDYVTQHINESDFIKKIEELLQSVVTELYMELFYKDLIRFKNAFPYEFNDKNERIKFDYTINYKGDEQIVILKEYAVRLRNVLETNYFRVWDDICKTIADNDSTMVDFTSYDIARKMAYYCMSITIMDRLTGINEDRSFVDKIRNKLRQPQARDIYTWWNTFDSLFDIDNRL